MSPPLQGGSLTTGSPGKSPKFSFLPCLALLPPGHVKWCCFIFTSPAQGECYHCAHFTDEKTKAQTLQALGPVTEPGLGFETSPPQLKLCEVPTALEIRPSLLTSICQVVLTSKPLPMPVLLPGAPSPVSATNPHSLPLRPPSSILSPRRPSGGPGIAVPCPLPSPEPLAVRPGGIRLKF